MGSRSSSLYRRTSRRRYRRNCAIRLPCVASHIPPPIPLTHLSYSSHPLLACFTVQTLGGRVESKVPRQGFMLTQPGSAEAERLRLCWASRDRPERYFVPYSYVEACKIAGTLLKQIFLENGEPIRFYIHPSIANPNARAALSARIAVSFFFLACIGLSWFEGFLCVPVLAILALILILIWSSLCGDMMWRAAFRWRSNGDRAERARYPRRSQYRGLPTPREELSGRSGQIRRVVPVGEEMRGAERGHIYSAHLQESRGTSARGRVSFS